MKTISKIIFPVCLCACVLFSSCAGGAERQPQTSDIMNSLIIREAKETADPEGAFKAIYESLEDYSGEALNYSGLSEYYGINRGDIVDFYAYRSNPRDGLCDIIIAKPLTYSRDSVRKCLYDYQNDRIQEFEDYNILSSFEIAKNAVVYDQGDYTIMLMFENNDAVKAIIDEYIPQ